jgi:hypothetical protein
MPSLLLLSWHDRMTGPLEDRCLRRSSSPRPKPPRPIRCWRRAHSGKVFLPRRWGKWFALLWWSKCCCTYVWLWWPRPRHANRIVLLWWLCDRYRTIALGLPLACQWLDEKWRAPLFLHGDEGWKILLDDWGSDEGRKTDSWGSTKKVLGGSRTRGQPYQRPVLNHYYWSFCDFWTIFTINN